MPGDIKVAAPVLTPEASHQYKIFPCLFYNLLYISHQTCQIFYNGRIPVVEKAAFPGVQRSDLFHITFIQLKIKYSKVLFHTFFLYTLRNTYDSSLQQPAKHHLGNSFPMLLSDLLKGFIVKEIIFPFCKRRAMAMPICPAPVNIITSFFMYVPPFYYKFVFTDTFLLYFILDIFAYESILISGVMN